MYFLRRRRAYALDLIASCCRLTYMVMFSPGSATRPEVQVHGLLRDIVIELQGETPGPISPGYVSQA